jgi:ribonuclease P protein component
VKRKFSLNRSTDFKRVRRFGKSYAHPFIVLIKHPNKNNISRFGIVAGRPVGNAVKRNRAKRRIREIVHLNMPKITPGWDIILLARKPIDEARFEDLKSALNRLFIRADLLNERNVD